MSDNECKIDCEFPRVYLLWEQNFKDLKTGQEAHNKKIDEMNAELRTFIKAVNDDKIEAAKNSWVPKVMTWLISIIGFMDLAFFGISKFIGK